MISTNDQSVDVISKPEAWDGFSSSYQNRIGACTMHGTARLVEILAGEIPFDEHSFVLDNGTGGGSIARNIKQKFPSTKILATDISPGMLKQVDALDLPGVTTQLEDAVTLSGLADDTFTHSLTSFAIQFTPSMLSCVHAMHRTLKPGGIAGFAIWGLATDIGNIHDIACTRLDPTHKPLDFYPAGAWSSEDGQRAAMVDAGFRNIHTLSVKMPLKFDSAEDYVHWWTGPYGNPVATQLLADWKEHGGSLGQLKLVIQDVVREQYDNGAGITMEAVLARGIK